MRYTLILLVLFSVGCVGYTSPPVDAAYTNVVEWSDYPNFAKDRYACEVEVRIAEPPPLVATQHWAVRMMENRQRKQLVMLCLEARGYPHGGRY